MKLIDEFLAQKRIAVVGVSRRPSDFNRKLFDEFRRRGYDAVPVNPQAKEIDGQPCFARVQDISPPVDAALLMTPARVTEQMVRDCAAAGISRVWMYRAVGRGAVSQAAVDYCQAHGIQVIAGRCPFMFFPGTAFFHRLHGVFLKLTGGYPTRSGR
ncbi:MAG: CoA-binding protein [Acidobacteriota bacterium]